MVSNNYRGHGLGGALFEHVINEAIKKDFIIIMSDFTELGRNHLKRQVDKVTEKLDKKNQSVFINAGWIESITPLLPKMFNGQWEAGKTMLSGVITDVKAFDKQIHEKKLNARSSNDFFDIEDEEKDFMNNLTKRFNKKPASKVKVR